MMAGKEQMRLLGLEMVQQLEKLRVTGHWVWRVNDISDGHESGGSERYWNEAH